MKGLYWLTVGVRKSTMVERARMMDMEMDSHIAFKVRMQRDEMNTYSQLTIIPLHFYTVQDTREGWCYSLTFRVCLTSAVKHFWKYCYRHAEMCLLGDYSKPI